MTMAKSLFTCAQERFGSGVKEERTKELKYEKKIDKEKGVYYDLNLKESRTNLGDSIIEMISVEEYKMEKYDWDLIDICLGEGSFGKVFRAIDKKTGKDYALKIITFEDEHDSRFQSGICETFLHRKVNLLHSEKFVRLFDAYVKTGETPEKSKQLILVLELCDCSLKDIIGIHRENNRYWTEEAFLSLSRDLLDGYFMLASSNF